MEDLCDRVALQLRGLGVNAVSWDSGGGMIGVGIARGDAPPDEVIFFFGTAGNVWEAEILDGEGEPSGSVSTSVDAGSTEPREIAAGIMLALAQLATDPSQ